MRRQVCKRITRRLRRLGLEDVAQYRAYLEACAAEWAVLDQLCHVTISRFWRDREVFAYLEHTVMPVLAQRAGAQGESHLWCWSAGCAAGEEAYSLVLLWTFALQTRFPRLDIRVVGTDADVPMLRRARRACYAASSLRELPRAWREQAFVHTAQGFCLQARYRHPVFLVAQDLRVAAPQRRFWLILCRNLAFTYFDAALQRQVLQCLVERLYHGGALVIGRRERLPSAPPALAPWAAELGVYLRMP